MKQIESLLDDLSSAYGKARVQEELIDISDCFTNAQGEQNPPRSFGSLATHTVVAYIVKNGPKVPKYVKHGNELVRDDKGIPQIAVSDQIKALLPLCIAPIKNVSYDEIADALKLTDNIQGFSRRHLKNIETKLQETGDFDPSADAAYFFSAGHEEAYHKARLNQYWMEKILAEGHRMLGTVSKEESLYMETVLPEEVLAGDDQSIKENSYMWGRPLHTQESEQFLERKVAAYQDFKKRSSKEFKVDTASNVIYSLVVGSLLDYSAGLRTLAGILASRGTASFNNLVTGGLYGTWQDKWYAWTNTSKSSHWLRKGAVDLLAFDTFQPLVYATGLAIGSLVQDGTIDYHHLLDGCENLIKISPLVAPTMNLFMRGARKAFGLQTSAEKVEDR